MAFGQLDRGGTPQPMHEINVTPLVDVMLVLLVVFIIAAPLLTNKVKLNLPKASAQPSATVEKRLVISLTRDAQLHLDGQPVSQEALRNKLRELVAKNTPPAVELRADGELAYQHVARLMALVQNAGVTKLSFITQPEAVATP
ncbi:MAG: biopolymer transporter ExbD [Gammaproteobacteria bacterium]|nr:biopolymer transporter ExbD [Gammaproteobacteria bacterium]